VHAPPVLELDHLGSDPFTVAQVGQGVSGWSAGRQRAPGRQGRPGGQRRVVRGTDGPFLARVDLAYVDTRLALEYDGREHHLEPGRFLHDRHRHHDLREVGWEVLRFTAHDVLRDRGASAARVRRFRERGTAGPVVGRW
jgi:hypothetical protein